MVNARISRSGFQLDVPVEIIAPAAVQIIGWEASAVVLQLPASRPDRLELDMHAGLPRRAPALLQVAGRAGRSDILPGRSSALGAREDMIERQLPARSAIDAAELVAKEQVESREGRIFGRLH